MQYSVIVKSSDSIFPNINIDFILIEFVDLDLALSCLYCPPQTTCDDIVFVIKHLKSCSS
jgi:hypothetical protein